jgi:hypothetical protein
MDYSHPNHFIIQAVLYFPANAQMLEALTSRFSPAVPIAIGIADYAGSFFRKCIVNLYMYLCKQVCA